MGMKKELLNIAHIDGQNLNAGAKEINLKVDFKKFRLYLKDKYHIKYAYYYLGHKQDNNVPMTSLYDNLQKAGFILRFKDFNELMLSAKKGNVDCDIIFHIMESLYKKEVEGKVLLISGDGDYKKTVDFLIQENKFLKILFPNKKFASSLYKKLGSEKWDYLNNIRNYIEYKKP